MNRRAKELSVNIKVPKTKGPIYLVFDSTGLNFYESCGIKELERIVEVITPKMLSKELKFLEENRLSNEN